MHEVITSCTHAENDSIVLNLTHTLILNETVKYRHPLLVHLYLSLALMIRVSASASDRYLLQDIL